MSTADDLYCSLAPHPLPVPETRGASTSALKTNRACSAPMQATLRASGTCRPWSLLLSSLGISLVHALCCIAHLCSADCLHGQSKAFRLRSRLQMRCRVICLR